MSSRLEKQLVGITMSKKFKNQTNLLPPPPLHGSIEAVCSCKQPDIRYNEN